MYGQITVNIFTEQFDYEKNISFKKDDTSQIFLDSETEVILKNIQDCLTIFLNH